MHGSPWCQNTLHAAVFFFSCGWWKLRCAAVEVPTLDPKSKGNGGRFQGRESCLLCLSKCWFIYVCTPVQAASFLIDAFWTNATIVVCMCVCVCAETKSLASTALTRLISIARPHPRRRSSRLIDKRAEPRVKTIARSANDFGAIYFRR